MVTTDTGTETDVQQAKKNTVSWMFVDTEITNINLRVLCNYQECSMHRKIHFKFIVKSLGRVTSQWKMAMCYQTEKYP